MVLRRPESPYESARFVLRGLDERLSYKVTDLDTQQQRTCAGKQLLQEGLEVVINRKPASAMVLYERQ